MPTFRRVTDAEVPAHQSIMEHAFGEDAGPLTYETADDAPDYLAERWGLFADDDLVSACLLYDLRATLAEATKPVGGIGGFATPPEHRSQGFGRQLQRAALETFRDRGFPYAVLWPVSVAYYRETGWGLAHCQTEYEFPPAAVEPVASTVPEGRFERVDADDLDRLQPIYEQFRERHVLALDRTDAWWRERVLDDAWAYCWTPADASEPTGYLVARLPGEHGEMTLAIDDLVAADVTARRALLAFLHRYSPQVEEIRWTCPEESRLVHEATDPDAVSASIEPGAMGRVVDVQAALGALPADRNPAEPLAITVRDALLETNDGSFAIEAGPDGPVVERLAADAATAITLDVRQLSRLFVGTTPVATLVEREGLSATEATISALDALFPPRRVFLPDYF